MARIPESELERLKQEVSLQRLVEASGVTLSRHGGKDLIGRCPFHADGTPSLVVSPKKNLWHCLGACQTGGTVVDWVMKSEGVGFREAVECLRKKAGHDDALTRSPLAADAEAAAAADRPERETEPSPDAKAGLLERVVDYYHQTLLSAPEGKAYLQSRGLDDAELISTFRLGLSNRTLTFQFPKKTTAEGKAVRSQLQALGVLRETGHEHFNGSLVVPIMDGSGRVVEMYGRKVTRNLRKGTPLHLYLPGPHAGVFNAAGIADAESVILCEALLDAMTFWCAGFRDVTASYGTRGFTAEHLARLRDKEVLIAYDRDTAGDAAAEALAETLGQAGCTCRRVRFPRGMDANAYAQTVQPARHALGLALKSAEWMTGPKPVAVTAAVSAGPVTADASAKGREGKGMAASPPPMGTPSKEGASVEAQEAAAQPDGGDVSSLPLSAPDAEAPSEPKHAEPVAEAADASPLAADTGLEVEGHQVVARYGDRRYRVRGLTKNQSYDILKVNLLLQWQGQAFPDQLDLYAARQRAGFVRQAASELGLSEETIRLDLGRLLAALEAHQEAALKTDVKPKTEAVVLTEAERKDALALLEAPDLVERILADFDRAGIVGEETNKLVGYLACTSRNLDRPLAVLVQSSSAAGKSSLMDAVLSMMPEEVQARFSAVTGQALYYLGETELKHKILAITEEEGAERASYALKLLQSEGELTIASTGKDPETGRLVTRPYHVEGPVMLFLTTTALDVDEELANRCIVLTVDEGVSQTEAIHRAQRSRYTLDGVLAKTSRQDILHRHRNAQRLLRRLPVVNPFAMDLTFTSHAPRTRRDHTKYLDLIATITLLHQYQRPLKRAVHQGQTVEYLEVTPADVELANRLAAQVLSRSLDELPPQTRKLLELIRSYVEGRGRAESVERTDVHFRQRELREATGWSKSQLHVHLSRLVEMEYLVAHGRVSTGFVYQLVELGPHYGMRDPKLRATSGPSTVSVVVRPTAVGLPNGVGGASHVAGSERAC